MWQQTKFSETPPQHSLYEIVLPKQERYLHLEKNAEELQKKLLDVEARLKTVEENEKKITSEKAKLEEKLKNADLSRNDSLEGRPSHNDKTSDKPKAATKAVSVEELHQTALVLEEAVYAEVSEKVLDDFGKIAGDFEKNF